VPGPREALTDADRPTPTSDCAASSTLRKVADNPHTRIRGANARSRASASSTCTPRFDASSSCHSSTTTARTPPTSSRARSFASNSVSDSGVVTSTFGSLSRCRARSLAAVSPVRDPTVTASPSSSTGSRSASSMSRATARSGVT